MLITQAADAINLRDVINLSTLLSTTVLNDILTTELYTRNICHYTIGEINFRNAGNFNLWLQ